MLSGEPNIAQNSPPVRYAAGFCMCWDLKGEKWMFFRVMFFVLCRLLTSYGQESSLRQPIGGHDVSLPESEYVGVEKTVERPAVADWMV